jgi:DDE superfamily endonuclease
MSKQFRDEFDHLRCTCCDHHNTYEAQITTTTKATQINKLLRSFRIVPTSMNNGRKRHREAEENDDAEPEEVAEVVEEHIDVLAVRFRKKLIAVIIGVISVMNMFMFSRNLGAVVPPSVIQQLPFLEENDEEHDEIFQPAIRFQNNLWARIVAIDEFSVDPTRRSEQPFWDTYRGREEDWYKEYRMSQRTFNTIVRDCVPFLYSRPTYSLKSARFRYLRAKVVMATLIRYLAIQSDQHTLGKEFGVRQSCVSKRIDRGCKALLSAYWFENCPYPKIKFPLNEGRREAARWFFRKCNIPYLCGSIDGSIIKIASPNCVNFIPREFWCKRKRTYSLNLMVVCDHQKKIIFADARWPGGTSDTGAVARSKFLTNLFVRRDPEIFPEPFMILADGGFHKRSCFIAPDLVARNQVENQFNTRISSARCVVENAFGLLKMKWRRLHQHAIAECTRVVPHIILCACVLHNICIDAGDVNDEEAAAVRDEDEAAADRAEFNATYERILRNNGANSNFT